MARLKSIAIAVILLVVCAAQGTASETGDIEQHRFCAQCGMDRKAYGYSRMLITYDDGTEVGVCSLHCAEMLSQKKTAKSIQVADRDSRILLEAGQAVWVVGGSKRGVMTKIPKWAFATKAGAEAFIKSHGGKIITWEEALRAAREEVPEKHE